MTICSGLTRAAGGGHLLHFVDRLLQREGYGRADSAGGGEADVGDQKIGAGLGHGGRLLWGKDVGRREHVQLMGDGDGLDLLVIAHARAFQILAEGTVEEADGGEVLYTAEADLFELLEKYVFEAEGIGAADSRQDRGILNDREYFGRHFDDDTVGVAIGHHAGKRPAAGHTKTAGVVDDDKVGAPGFGKLGRDSGAGPAADDGPSGGLLGLEAGDDLLSWDRHMECSLDSS